MSNKSDTQLQESKTSLYNETVNFFTRLVELIVLIVVMGTLIGLIASSLIPELTVMICSSMTEAQAGNMFELVRVWALPMLFLVILISAATIAFAKWFYKKSNDVMMKVRTKLISHHNKALERKELVAQNKKSK